jgi:patatin-related protein
MTSTAPSPSVAASPDAADQEVRLGVVMFGGISLAIYMNGISQEMLRLVRATAKGAGPNLLLRDDELRSTETVYRRIGQILCHGRKAGDPVPTHPGAPVRTRFVIDILSGTSAGGINATFLAKALANNQSLDSLTQTWREQADLDTLLNDGGSKPGKYPTDTPKRSLLNGRRMYALLVKAMNDMQDNTTVSVPLAKEIDLFVTTTDLNGVISPIGLADEVIEERVHKADFHFVYSQTRAGKPNDFIPAYDEMLAFAARCTSSFPLAFEPMRPIDADPVVPGFSAKLGNTNADVYRQFFLRFNVRGSLPPAQRSLADGGYLQNKPFSFVIDTIRFRTADLPVSRKILYIDPFPEQFNAADEVRFDFVQNSLLAAYTLPGYQTIRQDLERLTAYNRGVQAARSLMTAIETSEEFRSGNCPSQDGAIHYPQRTLKSMLAQRGPCYLGYHRLRVSSVTWDLALLVSRLFGFRDDSAELQAIRCLLHSWRNDVYHPNGDPGPNDGDRRPTENQFLADFDFGYRMRRVDHLLGRIDGMLASLRRGETGFTYGSNVLEFPPGALEWLVWLRNEVVYARRDLVIGRERLWLLYEGQPLDEELRDMRTALAERILKSGLLPVHLEWILKPVSEDDIQARADGLYHLTIPDLRRIDSGGNEEWFAGPLRVRNAFRDAAQELSQLLSRDFRASSAKILGALGRPLAASLAPLRDFLLREYDNFDCRDVYLFAAVQDHLTGEGVPVEVYRISPLEGRLRIASDPNNTNKLAGTSLMAFGAFLCREWRDHDILWGRLDGAERLIRSLLPEDADSFIRGPLIDEAIEIILDEDFKLNGADGLVGRLADFVRQHFAATDMKLSLVRARRYFGKDSKFNPRIMVPVITAIRKNATLRAVFENIYSKPAPPAAETQVQLIRRSLSVFSSMLQGLDDYSGVLKTSGRYIGSIGAFCTRFVEFSLGGTLFNALFRRWLFWLYSMEIMLIAVGLIYSPVKTAGWIAFGITAFAHAASFAIGAWFRRPGKTRLLAVAAVVLLLLLAASLRFLVDVHLSLTVSPRLRSWLATLS